VTVLRLLFFYGFSKHSVDKGGSTSVTVSAYHFIDSDLKVRPPRAPSGDLDQMGAEKVMIDLQRFCR
jgi:hypothetical protein